MVVVVLPLLLVLARLPGTCKAEKVNCSKIQRAAPEGVVKYVVAFVCDLDCAVFRGYQDEKDETS